MRKTLVIFGKTLPFSFISLIAITSLALIAFIGVTYVATALGDSSNLKVTNIDFSDSSIKVYVLNEGLSSTRLVSIKLTDTEGWDITPDVAFIKEISAGKERKVIFTAIGEGKLSPKVSITVGEGIQEMGVRSFPTFQFQSNPLTKLNATLTIIGPYGSPGDEFYAIVEVGNEGSVTANFVMVWLENVPSDWEVTPDLAVEREILPGQIEKFVFVVVRGPTDSVIWAKARALNAPEVQSNSVEIPELPLMLIPVVVVGMAMILHYTRKKW
jgi:hypothetical protein